MPDEPSDDEILARLRATDGPRWAALWQAAADVARLTEPATWAGGDTVDGVTHLPYPVYDPAVDRLLAALGAVAGGVVVFGWMDWDGVGRYRTPDAVLDAPIADIPRLITAIARSERFGDGNIDGAIRSGLVAAIVDRLRRWHDEERAPAS